jgi:hypothetical protein
MAAISTLIEDRSDVRKGRRRMVISVIVGAIIIHVIAGIIAGVYIVARYFQPVPATFVVKKDIRLPAQQREHKMNMASFDAAAPKPSFNDKLQSLRPTAFALPELPKVPLDQMLPLDPSAIVTDQVTSLAGTAGLGAGGQGAGGLGGTGTGISFLGVSTNAKRILLLYDISTTVANSATRAGFPMTRIRDETARLLDGLGVNVRFGMAEFARNYAFFRNELLPATDPNRAAAREWLNQYFATEGSMPRGVPGLVTGSPGFLVLLEQAFKLQPDTIFVISDGGFYSGSGTSNKISGDDVGKSLETLQKTLPQPAKIYFIGVGMKPENERDMRRVIARHGGGGKLSELK